MNKRSLFCQSVRCLGVVGLLALITQTAPARDIIVDPIHEYRDEVGRGEFQYDDSEDIPWIENEAKVLALPESADLSPVQLGRLQQGLELLIDKSRIDVNPDDRVIRVWLWMRSDFGAESGTFEGFRCETREYKVYAHANPRRDPPVSKVRRATWKSAGEGHAGGYRGELMRDYFCGPRGARQPAEIRDYLSSANRPDGFFTY